MSLLRLLLICFVLWDICYLIRFDVSFFSPHNWMAFVRLNKRHVMLCYVCSVKSPYVFPLSQVPLIYDSGNCVAVCSVVIRKKFRIGVKFRDGAQGCYQDVGNPKPKQRLWKLFIAGIFLSIFNCILEIGRNELTGGRVAVESLWCRCRGRRAHHDIPGRRWYGGWRDFPDDVVYISKLSPSSPCIISSLQGGPAKVKPLTFLLVTVECIGKIQWFLAHINYIQQQVVWCKFYHNKHLTR